jgi:hypothetical protein
MKVCCAGHKQNRGVVVMELAVVAVTEILREPFMTDGRPNASQNMNIKVVEPITFLIILVYDSYSMI